ncbi:Cysteine protease atg4a [Paramecium bursaria]
MLQSLQNNLQFLENNVSNQLLSAWYNTGFLIRATFQSELQDDAYIFGNRFNSLEDIEQTINSTFWFTYRSDFKSYEYKGQNFTSDAGWGCMIRVGQMLIAQFIKQHLKSYFDIDINKYNELVYEIIQTFDDSNEEKVFSIQNIMQEGLKEIKKLPGDWYSPNQIVYVLQCLLNKSRLEQLIGFEFIPFYDNVIDIELLLKKMNKPNNCRCQLKSFLDEIEKYVENDDKCVYLQNSLKNSNSNSFTIRKSSLDIQDKELYNKIINLFKSKICNECYQSKKNHLGVVILSRLGIETPNDDYISLIKVLMSRSYTQGVIGGTPRRANYIIGYSGDQFICLDPHRVQPYQQPSWCDDYMKTYFQKEVLLMQEANIDCSCGIVFYFKSIEDIAQFIADSYTYKQNMFYGFGIKNSKEKDKNKNFHQETEKLENLYRQKLSKLKENEPNILEFSIEPKQIQKGKSVEILKDFYDLSEGQKELDSSFDII